MSFKKRKELIYSIPTFLVVVITILFVFGICLSIANVFYPNPLSDAVYKGFFNGYQNMMNLVMGAMIASIIGLFSSVAIMDLKQEKDHDNLILGFYFELKEINEKIQTIPTDNLSNCAKWLQVEKNPIYYNSGLFFVFRKEMFLLEQPLLEKMISAYSKILFIEQQWKNVHLEDAKLDTDTPKIIQQLQNELNNLLPIIESEKQKIG